MQWMDREERSSRDELVRWRRATWFLLIYTLSVLQLRDWSVLMLILQRQMTVFTSHLNTNWAFGSSMPATELGPLVASTSWTSQSFFVINLDPVGPRVLYLPNLFLYRNCLHGCELSYASWDHVWIHILVLPCYPYTTCTSIKSGPLIYVTYVFVLKPPWLNIMWLQAGMYEVWETEWNGWMYSTCVSRRLTCPQTRHLRFWPVYLAHSSTQSSPPTPEDSMC